MKLLNLCCGSVRPSSTPEVEWINVDNLHATLLPGTPERENLDKETNYVNLDLLSQGGSPKREWSESFDGILASHCFEHWDCQIAAFIMAECRRCLKPGGVLLVSVPDASYFRQVHDRDTAENAVELFGEPIHLPDGETTFFGYGLWNRYHKAILTEDALWAYFRRAGFGKVLRFNPEWLKEPKLEYICHPSVLAKDVPSPLLEMIPLLNRLPFSLVCVGIKD